MNWKGFGVEVLNKYRNTWFTIFDLRAQTSNKTSRIRLDCCVNLFKPSGNFRYYQQEHSKILGSAQAAFMCFV
jgi:hypothetical protein